MASGTMVDTLSLPLLYYIKIKQWNIAQRVMLNEMYVELERHLTFSTRCYGDIIFERYLSLSLDLGYTLIMNLFMNVYHVV